MTETHPTFYPSDNLTKRRNMTDEETYQETPKEAAARRAQEAALPKMQLWERKLLDFSLRNALLNLRVRGKVVPLVGTNLGGVEDALQDGADFELISDPELSLPPADDSGMRDSSQLAPALHDQVSAALGKKRLTSYLSATELPTALKGLYRSSRSALEENGANTLFLVLGVLRWFEDAKATKPRYAPLLLLPVEIVRCAGNHYKLRQRDEDVILNTTLVEFLRQQHDTDLGTPLTPLPTDDSGIDVDGVLKTVRTLIADHPNWQVWEESLIGLFSFSKFVMWNDIHAGGEQMRRHPIIGSLVSRKLQLDTSQEAADASTADTTHEPKDFCTPVDADSSQLEAVIESGEGKSFILHGPPGTGKSQTITNIIANALYHGKRVLFVAEKMAALSVVQRRLKKIGIGDFCMEMHSNKATKSHFLAQMETALNIAHYARNEAFERQSAELFAQRQKLLKYMNALHRRLPHGLSTYECLTGTLEVKGEEIPQPDELAAALTKERLDDVCKRLTELDGVFRATGHPADHPLRELRVQDTSVQVAQHLTAALAALRQTAEAAEHASWFLPRLLKRRKLRQRLRDIGTGFSWDGLAAYEEAKSPVAELLKQIDTWQANAAKAHDWSLWCVKRCELERDGLASVVSYLLQSHKSGTATADALRKGILHKWVLDGIDASPELQMFNGQMLEQVIAGYRELAKQFQTLARQELYCRLAARIPNATLEATNNSEISILKRAIKSKGRGKTMRQLFDSIPTLLPRLCPCMLMSPLSVAQYIELGAPPFDLVLFDEASQMPTSEAVGAIARGKSLIVVGDPMQMPPTSFFDTATTNEDDAENDDMESILDDCLALSVPSRHLTWHYRSKHESLISFSNQHYYGGRLFTFPSTDDRTSKVTLVHVDGTYDMGKTRCNQAEAQAVVEEALRRLADDTLSRQSIGIVAFSKAQAELIEDLLTAELAKRPELERRAYDCADPLFVKNLENVQGDERDVILFSVGYGPDSTGKVSMNFGPLNNQGGERRLNVAVSRSCREMQVFSSLSPDQIDLSRTNAEGVKGLKAFLQYAGGGHGEGTAGNAKSANPSGNSDTLVDDIAAAVRTLGYEVDTCIGRSAFKIDIAVIHPARPDEYLLGILCDGTNYTKTKTTRDREIGQPGVLSMLGWHTLRVWAVDWFLNREQVIQRIASTLQECLNPEPPDADTTPAPTPPASSATPTPDTSHAAARATDCAPLPTAATPPPAPAAPAEEAAPRLLADTRQIPYTAAALKPCKDSHTATELEGKARQISAQIAKIIAAEQPITLALLTKRIAKLWNAKQSAKLSQIVAANLGNAYCDALQRDVKPFFWTDFDTSAHYKQFRTGGERSIEEIPLIEVINAAAYAVEQQVALPLTDLRTLTARLLGFTRTSEKVSETVDQAIDILKKMQRIELADDEPHTVKLRET